MTETFDINLQSKHLTIKGTNNNIAEYTSKEPHSTNLRRQYTDSNQHGTVLGQKIIRLKKNASHSYYHWRFKILSSNPAEMEKASYPNNRDFYVGIIPTNKAKQVVNSLFAWGQNTFALEGSYVFGHGIGTPYTNDKCYEESGVEFKNAGDILDMYLDFSPNGGISYAINNVRFGIAFKHLGFNTSIEYRMAVSLYHWGSCIKLVSFDESSLYDWKRSSFHHIDFFRCIPYKEEKVKHWMKSSSYPNKKCFQFANVVDYYVTKEEFEKAYCYIMQYNVTCDDILVSDIKQIIWKFVNNPNLKITSTEKKEYKRHFKRLFDFDNAKETEYKTHCKRLFDIVEDEYGRVYIVESNEDFEEETYGANENEAMEMLYLTQSLSNLDEILKCEGYLCFLMGQCYEKKMNYYEAIRWYGKYINEERCGRGTVFKKQIKYPEETSVYTIIAKIYINDLKEYNLGFETLKKIQMDTVVGYKYEIEQLFEICRQNMFKHPN